MQQLQSNSRQALDRQFLAGRIDWDWPAIKHGSEDWVQANFTRWRKLMESEIPELELIYAVPNGSNKSPVQRFVMQLTGLESGVPDVHLPLPKFAGPGEAMLWAGLWIEFKKPGGSTQKTQRHWHEMLRKYGHRVEICRSWQDAVRLVLEYLGRTDITVEG